MSNCRSCGDPLRHSVVDLGLQPLANTYPGPHEIGQPDPVYPLHPHVCETCWLMQVNHAVQPEEIFSDYAYYSSFSTSWLEHATAYAERMVEELHLGTESTVVEVASNDGYLLRNFVNHGISVRGIEPARNVAAAAVERGIPTEVAFLGRATAERLRSEGLRADLLIGNNVLAHVPELNDFVAGLATLLAPQGTLTMEFPHVLRLIEESQFDTIYHEHFSYLSLMSVRTLFTRHGLDITSVHQLGTHGGSLRITARHRDSGATIDGSVPELERHEREHGLADLAAYQTLGARAQKVKDELLSFLTTCRAERKRVVAYGAPAKGNTLLNYAGVNTASVDYTVDRSPHKQGRFLPGSRIPIYAPEHILDDKPDYILLLPWNLRDEIATQMSAVRKWDGKFVVPIPRLEIF